MLHETRQNAASLRLKLPANIQVEASSVVQKVRRQGSPEVAPSGDLCHTLTVSQCAILVCLAREDTLELEPRNRVVDPRTFDGFVDALVIAGGDGDRRRAASCNVSLERRSRSERESVKGTETARSAPSVAPLDTGKVAFSLRIFDGRHGRATCYRYRTIDERKDQLETRSFSTTHLPSRFSRQQGMRQLGRLHPDGSNNAALHGSIPGRSCNALRSVHISVRPRPLRGLDVPRGVRSPHQRNRLFEGACPCRCMLQLVLESLLGRGRSDIHLSTGTSCTNPACQTMD